MKTITLKVIESKNPGIKIQWIKELDSHGRICRIPNFVVDENEIFCDSCYRTLLKFCSFCGSTRIEESKFHYKCSVCGSIIYKNFL
jgi:hypothetical protein